MKSWTQWIEENKLTLPVFTDAPEGEKATSEQKSRTGVGPQYPAGYHSSQYPDLYKTPSKATAPLDLENEKKKRDIAG